MKPLFATFALLGCISLPAQAQPARVTTQDQLVKLFEETCLHSFPDFEAIHQRAKRMGYKRLSETQSEANGTASNVVTYLYKGKRFCIVNAIGLPVAGLAQSLTSAMAKRGATNMKIRANGRVGKAQIVVNGKRADISSQPFLASTRMPSAKITIEQRK